MPQTKNIKPETIPIETMDTPVFVKFTLLENALDSIEQGLTSFYLAEKNNSNRHYKRCLLDLFQGAELLLKATLSRIDELLIFDDRSLSKCINPAKPTKRELYSCFTVNIITLTSLVEEKYTSSFPENGLSLINTLAIERNKIQHFAIEIVQNTSLKCCVNFILECTSRPFS
ncbi:hypothetical protein [Aeromonas jandaei]|uniref:hypothetical protein n=1 Tax=Aeromonas jandaei TaxID=650 RepID=UPI003F795A0C